MSKRTLYQFQVARAGVRQAARRVPEDVKAMCPVAAFDLRRIQGTVETPANARLTQRLAVLAAEDEIIISREVRLRPVRDEQGRDGRMQAQCAHAGRHRAIAVSRLSL